MNEKSNALLPTCLFRFQFSVSNSTEADALPCVLQAIPQQKDSSDWIGMVAMVAEGHKLRAVGLGTIPCIICILVQISPFI